jgi:hypothetical protein
VCENVVCENKRWENAGRGKTGEVRCAAKTG